MAATAAAFKQQPKGTHNNQALDNNKPSYQHIPTRTDASRPHQTDTSDPKFIKSNLLSSSSHQTTPQATLHHQLDLSEKQNRDNGKRTLIKNQLYLIEQLQLENANLRNERDQLQLENEELKFQLQMISSSNILTPQSGGTFAGDHRQQLAKLATDANATSAALVSNNCNALTDNHLTMTTAAMNMLATTSTTTKFPLSSGSDCNTQQAVTSASGLARITATPLRQPIRVINGSSEDNQSRFLPASCARAASSSTLTLAAVQRRHDGENAAMYQQEQSRSNKTVASTDPRFLSAKSSSMASFNVGQTKPLAGSSNLLPTDLRQLAQISSDTNHDNDDNQQQLCALKLVCARLNISDGEKVVAAALVIQRAFRKYQICKRFLVITEQLRHASKSSAQVVLIESEKNHSSPSNISYASGTTRAAAWESLSYAASRLVTNAAAKKQALNQQLLLSDQSAPEAMIKSTSNQQVQTTTGANNNLTSDSSKSKLQLRSSSATPNLSTHSSRQISTTTGSNSAQLKASDQSVVAAALSFQQLEALRKRQYRVGLNIFNKSPEKGVSFLIAHSFIDSSSPYTKSSSTSYYLANQLHFMDKQNFAQQQATYAHQQCHQRSLASDTADQHRQRQTNCQLCVEEENLKRNIAHFLLNRKGLAKEKIGQYLGNLQSQFNQDVLSYYLQELDFYGLQIDIALRKFSSTMRMPGEAQKIERFVDYFAQRYVQCQQQPQQQQPNIVSIDKSNTNLTRHVSAFKSASTNDINQTPQNLTMGGTNKRQQNPYGNNKNSNLTLLSRDEIFILTFAIIMLNTDLHSPSLKSTSRMSGQQFINNLRGIFKSQTISENDLLEIYDRVKANQITTTPDHVTHVLKVQQGLTVNNFQKKDTIPNLCVPHRRLVCFCRLYEVYDVNKKERVGQHQREIFLFNDMMLVTKLARRARTNTSQQYTYRQSIPLHGLYVQLFQSAHYSYGIRLCKRSTDETLIMFNARNELDQSRFVGDLSESIKEMEEMELIRVHNIIDIIHMKHQERLRRHALMHEMQSPNEEQPFEANDKLSNGLTMISFKTRSRVAPNEKLATFDGTKLEISKENTAPSDGQQSAVKSGARRLQSKFNSMSNLFSVSEGQDNDESISYCANGSSNETDSTKMVESTTDCESRSKPFLQPLKNLKQSTVSGERSKPLSRRANVVQRSPDRLNRNQRSCSTASVHSLDSGLFLSRDVSPNQSG